MKTIVHTLYIFLLFWSQSLSTMKKIAAINVTSLHKTEWYFYWTFHDQEISIAMKGDTVRTSLCVIPFIFYVYFYMFICLYSRIFGLYVFMFIYLYTYYMFIYFLLICSYVCVLIFQNKFDFDIYFDIFYISVLKILLFQKMKVIV